MPSPIVFFDIAGPDDDPIRKGSAYNPPGRVEIDGNTPVILTI